MGAMELEEKTVQIRDDFDPDKILESGQCFRPRKQAEGWYRFVSGRQLLYLRPLRSGTYTVRCEPGAWDTFWHGYFDLGRSYAALRGKLDSRDDFLQRAMEYGRGIRVLRQDEWEMLVSFIISQRKSIPAIRRAVELLSERFGERLGSDSEGPVYAFPTAEALCCAGEQALQECGLGYRTRYVLHAAQQAAEGTLDLKKLASLFDGTGRCGQKGGKLRVSVRLWPCGPCAGGCLDRTAHPGRVCRAGPVPAVRAGSRHRAAVPVLL